MKNEIANGIKKLFFTIIALLSMTTSFLYFVEVFSFGRGLVSDTWMSVLINGTVGVIVLDIAAIAWLKIYLGASDNNTVRALAATGFIIGLIGSAISSFAYLFSVADDFYLPPNMRVYTQIAMAAIIVIHFVLVFLSQYKSTQARIDEKTAAMMSEATEEMLKLSEEYFRASIPGLARQNAIKLTERLRGQFAKLTPDELAAPLTVAMGDSDQRTAVPEPSPSPSPNPNGQTPPLAENGRRK